MKKELKLNTGTAIDTLISVAKKLDLNVNYESTGVKDSVLGIEKHMWLEDKEGNTKGSYFYWKNSNNVINNAEGLTYTNIDSKTNDISVKAISDVKEIYKKFDLRMPKQKKVKKSKKIDRWAQIHDKWIEISNYLYQGIDFEEDDMVLEKEEETPGFIDAFKNFSENGLEEYWDRIEREIFQLEVWEEKELEQALFRIMDDYTYEGIGGFKTTGCVAWTLSFYFTPVLKVLFRWSDVRIDMFWDSMIEN